jgi:hypothetical protein
MKLITCDYVCCFGNDRDGVLELVLESKGKTGKFSAGYYRSDDKLKSIIDISSMAGCPFRCNFCALGDTPFLRALTPEEMLEQVEIVLSRARMFFKEIDDKKHKITIAKSGEPLLNFNLVDAMGLLGSYANSFKISSIFPAGAKVKKNLESLARFASTYSKPVQLQVSILSTDDEERLKIAGAKVASLCEINEGLILWRDLVQGDHSRVPNLSITLTEDTECSPSRLIAAISPAVANIRFRPYIETENGTRHQVKRVVSRLDTLVQEFKNSGFKVSIAGIATPVEEKYHISSVSELEVYENRLRIV